MQKVLRAGDWLRPGFAMVAVALACAFAAGNEPDPRAAQEIPEAERRDPRKLPVPIDARVKDRVGDPGVKARDTQIVVNPDDGAGYVVGGTYSTVSLNGFEVVPAPELGPRMVRIDYDAQPAHAVTHYRIFEAGANGAPWRPVSTVASHRLSCGEEIKDIRFQVRGDPIPNPQLPSQLMENRSETLQRDVAVPAILRTQIEVTLPDGPIYPHTVYSAGLKVTNFVAGSVPETEFQGVGCIRTLPDQGGGWTAPDAEGVASLTRRMYLPASGSCTPAVSVPLCPGRAVSMQHSISVAKPEIATFLDSWELQGILDFANANGPLFGVCDGFNEAKIGVMNKNGKLAIEVRPTPGGARCTYSSKAFKLPDGAGIIDAIWSIHKGGLCRVNDPPVFGSASLPMSQAGAIVRANGHTTPKPPMAHTYAAEELTYKNLSLGEGDGQDRLAYGLPMTVQLECPPGPPGSGFVRVELDSVILGRHPGSTWPPGATAAYVQ